MCENCAGDSCRKINLKYYLPKISGDEFGYELCKYRPQQSDFRRAMIPLRYAGKTFDDYEITDENDKAVRAAKWFVGEENPLMGLYFCGETGTGKTFLAALIAGAYLLNEKSVIFGDVPSLLADLKATFNKGGTEALLDRYCECDLLVLDDIGAGKISDWSVGVLYQVVNARYNAGKTIIATGNYTLKRLREILSVRDERGNIVDDVTGKRIVSRLSEMTYKFSLGEIDRRAPR